MFRFFLNDFELLQNDDDLNFVHLKFTPELLSDMSDG